MPAAAAIAPDGTILRPRKGRPPKGGYPYPYPTSTDPARTIYIGKNNARHWADLKQRLGYNGDVDFVSFLLRLAEERLSQEEQVCGTSKTKRNQINGRTEHRASSVGTCSTSGETNQQHDLEQQEDRQQPMRRTTTIRRPDLAKEHLEQGNGEGESETSHHLSENEEISAEKKLKLEDSAEEDGENHADEYDFHDANTTGFSAHNGNSNDAAHNYVSEDEEEMIEEDDEEEESIGNTSTTGEHEQGGEYVCNFCNKSFLRPTYLNVHRTYGCPANPDRCRPQCHLCGKDFSQPQKLKAHIESEHGGSDFDHCEDAAAMAGGLAVGNNHPCKACPAVFTTRAALRRHLGEIHGQGASGTCVCDQCGKLFQTKSNLKIHLLTHSGVKPFKCPETECGLGFSTKQCLQVHLRKAHGYTEDNMPQVQRSIPYTFDAYSGGVVKDPGRGKLPDFPTTPTRLQQLDQTGQQDGSNPPGTPRAYPIPEMPRRGRKPGWRKANSANAGAIVNNSLVGGNSLSDDMLHGGDVHKLRDKDDVGSTGPLPPFTPSAAAVVAELAIQSLAAAAAAAAASGNDSPDHADLNSPAAGGASAGALNYHNSPGPLPMTPEPQAMALNLAASRNQTNYGDYPPSSPSPWQQPQQHFEDNYPALARPQPVNARATPVPQQQTFYPERPSSCYSFEGNQQPSQHQNYGAQQLLQPPAPPAIHSYGSSSSSSNSKLLPPVSPSPQTSQDLSRCGTPLAEPSFSRFAAAAAVAAVASTSSSRCPPTTTSPGSATSSSNPYPSPAPSPGYASVTSRVFSGSYGLQNWGNVNMQGLSGYSQSYPLPPPSPYPRNPYGGYY